MKINLNYFTDGIIKNNAVFKQLLALCSTLAVTTSLKNGVGMGLATTMVLIGASVVVSSIKKFIPSKIRIPAFIVIIATFTTIVDLLMKAYLNDLHRVLGLFIPLIVVNCVVLGRAESFASKNNVFNSFLDAAGSGVGFTIALCALGIVRELLGSGAFMGIRFVSDDFPTAIIFILPPGAFIVLGFLLAVYNKLFQNKEAR